MEKLKPCPFCGGKTIEISWQKWGWQESKNDIIVDEYETHRSFKVECADCGCTSPDDLWTFEDAVKYWNTRKGEPDGINVTE